MKNNPLQSHCISSALRRGFARIGRSPRLVLVVALVALLLGACAYVEVHRYVLDSDLSGTMGHSMTASHRGSTWLAFPTSSSGTSSVTCWSPKADYHLGTSALPGDSFTEEMAEDVSTADGVSTQRLWMATTEIVGSTFYNELIPFNRYCNYSTSNALTIPGPFGSFDYARVAGYDIDTSGNHFVLLEDHNIGYSTQWRVARYDKASATWSNHVISPAPSAWSTTNAIDGIRLAVDTYPSGREVVVGNEEQVLLDPDTLTRNATRSLAMPSGYEMQDFGVYAGYTLAAISTSTSGWAEKAILFTDSGSVDTTNAEVDFTSIRRIITAKETSDLGSSPSDACGESLRFDVLGQRSDSDHYVHSFYATVQPCDPFANGDPGF